MVLVGILLDFGAERLEVLSSDKVQPEAFVQQVVENVPAFECFRTLQQLDQNGLILCGELEVINVQFQDVADGRRESFNEFLGFSFFDGFIEYVPESVFDGFV